MCNRCKALLRTLQQCLTPPGPGHLEFRHKTVWSKSSSVVIRSVPAELVKMDFEKVARGRGCKYVCENMMYTRQNVKKGVMYLTCDRQVGNRSCEGRAKILDDKLHITHPHSQHETMCPEITKMKLLSECRKRAADVSTDSLRSIFDREMRTASTSAATQIAFNEVESSMYKRRRLVQPRLPDSAENAEASIIGTDYATLDDQLFYR
jgi:hypothetical protein